MDEPSPEHPLSPARGRSAALAVVLAATGAVALVTGLLWLARPEAPTSDAADAPFTAASVRQDSQNDTDRGDDAQRAAPPDRTDGQTAAPAAGQGSAAPTDQRPAAPGAGQGSAASGAGQGSSASGAGQGSAASGAGQGSASGPATGPATTDAREEGKNTACRLRVDGAPRPLTAEHAQTMTMLAAVGAQVDAPEEAVADIIDTVRDDPKASPPNVTEALKMFTRADADLPTADPATVARLQALSEPAALTCRWPKHSLKDQDIEINGLTPRAEQVRFAMLGAFGDLPLGGFAGGTVESDNGTSASHEQGRAMDVYFRPVSAQSRATGWMLAHWLVARGADYGLQSVIFDSRIWSTRASGQGWRTHTAAEDPGGGHRDYLHVAVADGS